MLEGDNAGSWRTIEAALAAGYEPDRIYVEVLAPALHAIGDGWRQGAIPIEREHLASGVATSIIGRLGPRFRRRGRHLGSVAVAMPAGERHGLGVAMLGDILTGAGYDVLNLGPDTPPRSLAAAILSRDDLRAVIISVVDDRWLDAATELVAAARESDPDVPIIVGGYAITDEAHARRLGADAWSEDPRGIPVLISTRAAGPLSRRLRRQTPRSRSGSPSRPS